MSAPRRPVAPLVARAQALVSALDGVLSQAHALSQTVIALRQSVVAFLDEVQELDAPPRAARAQRAPVQQKLGLSLSNGHGQRPSSALDGGLSSLSGSGSDHPPDPKNPKDKEQIGSERESGSASSGGPGGLGLTQSTGNGQHQSTEQPDGQSNGHGQSDGLKDRTPLARTELHTAMFDAWDGARGKRISGTNRGLIVDCEPLLLRRAAEQGRRPEDQWLWAVDRFKAQAARRTSKPSLPNFLEDVDIWLQPDTSAAASGRAGTAEEHRKAYERRGGDDFDKLGEASAAGGAS